MKKSLIFSDVHLEHRADADPSYILMKRIIQKEKFDRIIINGDFLDFSYISRFTKEQPLLNEGARLQQDFMLLQSELKYMKKYAKEVVYLEGNHERRLRTLQAEHPALAGLFSISDICSSLGVQWVEIEKQPHKLLDDVYIVHGLAFNKFLSAGTVEKAGVSIIMGHAHRTQSFTTSFLNGKPITGYALGCISSINPSYVAGTRITGWSQSFGIISETESLWDLQTFIIKNNHALIGNRLY